MSDTPRSIAVLTTGRQDWGILRSTALAIAAHPALRLRLLAGGMHAAPGLGETLAQVGEDGLPVEELGGWLASEAPADVQAARALEAVGAALRAGPADALVLAGDRFETAAAAIAATVNLVPIVHLHGGEQTFGAFDDALRHAVTRLAHLHLVSSEEHAARVVALGEDPGAVHVVGAPGLDQLHRDDLPGRDALAADLGIPLEPPVVIVTVHPTTLAADPSATARAVAVAMDAVPATYVITLPNADPGASAVRSILETAASAPARVAVEALGTRRYWGLMRIADAMLGNSSSAIVEAPAAGLPAVDVGDRQGGRQRGATVRTVPDDPDAVAAALRAALDPAALEAARAARPALVDGRVGDRIAAIIAGWHPSRPPRKAPVVVPAVPHPRGRVPGPEP